MLAGRADRRIADDEKSGVGPVLAHQRDAVDRHEAAAPSGGEPVLEIGQDDGLAIRPEPAGHRQMQAEIDRGRDSDCSPPPAQTRTGPIKASGSYLEYLTAKRALGQG